MKKYENIIVLVILFIFLTLHLVTRNPNYFDSITFFKKNTISNVTIITIYFKFSKSKHNTIEYENWSRNFMQSIGAPLIIYTDTSSFTFLKNQTKQNNVSAQFIIFKDVWQLFHQVELWRKRNYAENYQNKQMSLDPEKSIHNPNLYAVWNSKHYVMQSVVDSNPFKSSFFIYTDIGAWRGQVIKNWPDIQFVQKLASKLNNNILYGQITKVEDNNQTNPISDIIQATFIAGNKVAVKHASKEFYEIHDDLFDKGIFVGKDQNLMNYMTYVKKLKFIKKLRTWSVNCSIGYDQWFFYQYFFANLENYPCSNDKFSLIF